MSRRQLAAIGGMACAACCAGPLLGVLGGIGVVGLLGAPVVGASGLVVTVVAGLGLVVARRLRTRRNAAAGPVSVELIRPAS